LFAIIAKGAASERCRWGRGRPVRGAWLDLVGRGRGPATGRRRQRGHARLRSQIRRGSVAASHGSRVAAVVGGGEGVGRRRWRWVGERSVRVGEGEVRCGPTCWRHTFAWKQNKSWCVRLKLDCGGVISMYLRCLAGDRPRQWLQWLPWAEFCYNTSF
jgi:hypothetical protein